MQQQPVLHQPVMQGEGCRWGFDHHRHCPHALNKKADEPVRKSQMKYILSVIHIKHHNLIFQLKTMSSKHVCSQWENNYTDLLARCIWYKAEKQFLPVVGQNLAVRSQAAGNAAYSLEYGFVHSSAITKEGGWGAPCIDINSKICNFYNHEWKFNSLARKEGHILLSVVSSSSLP